MKDLIESYEKEAVKMAEYMERLKSQLETERDVNERKSLQRRIYAAEVERFEILEDIIAMRKYL
ncbi:MAG: hypothetical protein LUG49_08870 [Oscillospiraceae bacterium]|nr:hypothetical protein [Oscillospiraceae bacterium]MCD7848119.1 hypothetical protein [Oscillospiraceae bacterium]